jgi:3'-phosphoadenosine 5'-phosphosulfate sulfotransferase (PAPS reductase)/FAD synthetase
VTEEKQQHILAYSGGKESTVLLFELRKRGYPLDRVVFCDSGLELPEVYAYLDEIEKKAGVKIERMQPKTTWDKMFYGLKVKGKWKGRRRGFPFVMRNMGCWASTYLKLNSVRDLEKGNVVYLGIAADETARVQVKGKRLLEYPLIEWGMKSADCRKYLEDRGLINPLYRMHKRIGCWCCPKQNRHSLQMLFTYYPELWKKLKQYEKDSPQGFRDDITLNKLEARYEAQGIKQVGGGLAGFNRQMAKVGGAYH